MKFLVYVNGQFQEELDGVANGLANNGHEIFAFGNNIYRAFQERPADAIIFNPTTYNLPETQKFIKNVRPNFILVNSEQIRFSDGNSVNLPSFASTLKYKPELRAKELECDIAVCSTGENPDYVHNVYTKFYKTHSIKIVGVFINCPGFIGMCVPADVVKLAKSAKLTICSNKIITHSLIYNNIYAALLPNDVNALLELPIDEQEQLVLETKKKLVTETMLGKMICEKFSNSNR